MTRINCVPPEELTDRHLVAEYYELPRVFTLVKRAMMNGKEPSDYQQFDKYTTGNGHVKFFYTRLKYCAERQIELIEEMKRRNMRPTYGQIEGLLSNIPQEWFGPWEPTSEALKINRERLQLRLKGTKAEIGE